MGVGFGSSIWEENFLIETVCLINFKRKISYDEDIFSDWWGGLYRLCCRA